VGGFCYIILILNLSNTQPTGFFLHRFRNIANIKFHLFFFLLEQICKLLFRNPNNY
jgi:hypothetical protein